MTLKMKGIVMSNNLTRNFMEVKDILEKEGLIAEEVTYYDAGKHG